MRDGRRHSQDRRVREDRLGGSVARLQQARKSFALVGRESVGAVFWRVAARCPLPPASLYSRSRLNGATSRRGGRVVECGGLENRLGGIPSYEGSNPSLSATMLGKRGPEHFERSAGVASFSGKLQTDCKRDLGSQD